MSPRQSLAPEFAAFVVRELGARRVLLVEADERWQNALSAAGAEVFAFGSAIREFDLAIWFVSEIKTEPTTIIADLAARSGDVILISNNDGDLAKQRPQLVALFAQHHFTPDYDCDLSFIDPSALRLRHASAKDPTQLIAGAESAVARLNSQMQGLQRALRTRIAELDTADRHIATLEGKLLKLKEARRELKKLKQEKQELKKAPERKVGQVLLAPYLLPKRLLRGLRKRWPRPNEQPRNAATEYQRWFEKHRVTPAEFPAMREEIKSFQYQPCITIITPVYNTPLPWLEDAVRSVLDQVYEKWELILIDDNSSDEKLTARLAELPKQDSRIVLERLSVNGGISAASNRGLAIAAGDWVGFLDHDDLLEPDALFQNVKWLQDHEADLIYSDEDKLTEEGLDSPIFKPDWSPDYFLSCNYVCHFTLVRRSLLREINGFRSGFDGAQDYDLFFRVIEKTKKIEHIPRVLYHWRRSAVSTADNIRRKPGSLETGRRAVEAHLERTGQAGHVTVDWRTHAYWIKRELRATEKISIIIPVRDRIDLLARCVESITRKTIYPRYEIVIVDNDSETDEARAYFSTTKHRLLRYAGPFNFAAINNFAVEKTDSPWLLFLNSDIEVIDDDWLNVLAEHVQRPEVGAVGARLIFPDETVQHAGVVVGVGGIAEHAFRGFPAEAPGVCRQLQVTRNYSALTGACLMTRREVFDEVGGFDEEQLPVTFNDVDLCLKMRRAGYLIVYNPFVKLYHHESATRRLSVEPRETNVMQERWAEVLANDPYYNPNLSRLHADFSLRD